MALGCIVWLLGATGDTSLTPMLGPGRSFTSVNESISVYIGPQVGDGYHPTMVHPPHHRPSYHPIHVGTPCPGYILMHLKPTKSTHFEQILAHATRKIMEKLGLIINNIPPTTAILTTADIGGSN